MIKQEMLQHTLDSIVEKNTDAYTPINKAIKLLNKGKMSLDLFTKTVSNIYLDYKINYNKQFKRNILICINSLGGGGAEKVLINILKKLDYNKFNIDLLLLDAYGTHFKDLPCEVNCFIAESIRSRIKKDYDIEIAFLEGPATKFIANRDNDAKKIAWVHIDLKENHWTNIYYKDKSEELDCYKKMDQTVFVSKNALHKFNKLFNGIEPSKQKVVYNIIDKKEILRKKFEFHPYKSKFTICSVGRLIDIKGFLRVIPILHKLLTEDRLEFECWIIGEGEQRNELERLIHKFSIEKSVKLWGYHDNPYPYMNTSDIFFSSSYVEGFSLVIAEALCLGKPIISTRTAGSAELLDNGKYGILVEQENNSIYDGLKTLITDGNLRSDLKKRSTERAKIFNIPKTMEQIYTVFDS